VRARPPAKGGTYVRARRLVRPNGRKMDARLPPEMSPGGGSHRVGSSLRDVLSTAIRESGPVGDGSKTRGSCFVKPLNKTLLTYPEAETHTHTHKQAAKITPSWRYFRLTNKNFQ